MKYLVLAFVVAGCTMQQTAAENGDPAGVGGGPTTNPYDTPPVCTSNVQWTRGDQRSSLMHPGGACISCHDVSMGAPVLAFAGTVYPTAHEPSDCNGVAGGAQVIVTDAAGQMFSTGINGAGNFFLRASKTMPVTFPITAKVIANGVVREMTTPQDNGDCNSCHTESGDSLAPGRIMLPN